MSSYKPSTQQEIPAAQNDLCHSRVFLGAMQLHFHIQMGNSQLKWAVLQPQIEYFALNRNFANIGKATPVRLPIRELPLLSASVQTTAKTLSEKSSS